MPKYSVPCFEKYPYPRTHATLLITNNQKVKNKQNFTNSIQNLNKRNVDESFVEKTFVSAY